MIKIFIFTIFCANGDVIKQKRLEIPLEDGKVFMQILESDTIKNKEVILFQ